MVLRGVNGAGKTNILEAISLLAPGRGLRSARLRQMDALGAGGLPWTVAAHVETAGEAAFIGTARDGASAAEKRIIKINGEKVKSIQHMENMQRMKNKRKLILNYIKKKGTWGYEY